MKAGVKLDVVLWTDVCPLQAKHQGDTLTMNRRLSQVNADTGSFIPFAVWLILSQCILQDVYWAPKWLLMLRVDSEVVPRKHLVWAPLLAVRHAWCGVVTMLAIHMAYGNRFAVTALGQRLLA